MNRKRRAKGENILRGAEAKLLEHLLRVLPAVVNTGEPLFTNSRFNPHGLLEGHLSKEAEALIDLSLACVEMRESLDLPVSGSVGKLFVEACEEAASSDEHRRGPRRLAAALFATLTDAA